MGLTKLTPEVVEMMAAKKYKLPLNRLTPADAPEDAPTGAPAVMI